MTPAGRTRTRLVLRDLSATAAFASIVLSGSVPAWALVAYGLALLTSLLGRRPLTGRPTVSVILLLLTAVVLFGASFRGMIDLVVAACTFAGLVTSHRLLSEPTSGTDQQVHLTSLLMLAGGAALTGELWYGLCLSAFAVTSSISLGLSVIEPEGGSSEQLEVRPLVRSISAGTLIALLGAMGFFVLFPRLSWNIASRRTPPGLLGGTTGMSDSVRLGGAGDIKSSPRAVARVKVRPDPGSARLDAYFPGRSFDVFDGREWRGTGKAKPSRQMVRLVKELPRKTVSQSIELLPGYGSRTLLGLEHPVTFTAGSALTATGVTRTAFTEVPDEEVRIDQASNGYSYSVSSAPELQRETLEDAERYQRLPDALDPRVKALADQVLGAETRPLASATALQRYLQREYAYTLELGGDVADPLADFLFVRKAGHCEHFATALTVLLRTRKIPARVTAGFFGGERVGSAYVLRAGDAHAWTQVFVDGRGWVTVDATPASGRGNQPPRLLAWLASTYERLEDWWRARVVDYSFQDQVDIARSLVSPPREASSSRWSLPALPGLWPTLAALAAAIAVYGAVQRGWGARRGKRHAATGFLEQIEARLDRAGIARLPGEPLEELTARLSQIAHPIAPALSRATRAYLLARFGNQSLPATERAALLQALVRRDAPSSLTPSHP
ncbi:MAG: DUF3488 domain-containing protein [Archangiaceae bacterium]|nr:DUF3488 domain-containing protein [Archangiaceae bacterium]